MPTPSQADILMHWQRMVTETKRWSLYHRIAGGMHRAGVTEMDVVNATHAGEGRLVCNRLPESHSLALANALRDIEINPKQYLPPKRLCIPFGSGK